MVNAGKIRVLIVDDSPLFREVIAIGISSDPRIEVVAKASDPFEARDMILRFKPDVMTCDVEMPKMNGIEFIRRLLPQYPLPVIVVSTISHAVFDAMNAGAVDFVLKPDVQSLHSVEKFILDMIVKVKAAACATVKIAENTDSPALSYDTLTPGKNAGSGRLIAIGASTGGTEAIYNILKKLPPIMPGIVIVQHIPPVFSRMFAERLDSQTNLNVKEAQTGDRVEPGQVLIAPGDRHMRIKKADTGYKAECFPGDKVNGHCPSVDILFESVAKECGSSSLGIILTGMGYDGAKGLLAMRRKGARTIGQDQSSSVVYGMPKVAFETGAVEKQVPLNNIPRILCSMLAE